MNKCLLVVHWGFSYLNGFQCFYENVKVCEYASWMRVKILTPNVRLDIVKTSADWHAKTFRWSTSWLIPAPVQLKKMSTWLGNKVYMWVTPISYTQISTISHPSTKLDLHLILPESCRRCMHAHNFETGIFLCTHTDARTLPGTLIDILT